MLGYADAKAPGCPLMNPFDEGIDILACLSGWIAFHQERLAKVTLAHRDGSTALLFDKEFYISLVFVLFGGCRAGIPINSV